MLKFAWDEIKARVNENKRAVSFSEASTVFFDLHARVIDDPDHSQEEERFVILGLSQAPRLIVVVHCYREQDDLIRIISARKATKGEACWYHEGNGMRDEYDFSSARENPYLPKLKKQITIRIDEAVIDWFRQLAEETGLPYQNLINQYLAECARTNKKYSYTFS